MSKKLSPAFVALTQDALLKAIWFKDSMRMFLIQHRISESALAQWHSDQTKRDFIAWLWPKLVKNDKGQNAILSMARSLAEMNHFPDLERKEDTKEKIPVAVEAINRLRAAVAEINSTIRESNDAAARRKAAKEETLRQQASLQSLDKLNAALNGLTSKIGTQEGGYEFERWIYDLAIYFDLDARPGYKAAGRQIDGAITIDGTTFLIEAKLVNDPIGSPDIDIFMAKIESKADNTMGLFISLSGFNEGAKKTASKQRTPMLLIDSGHIFNLVMRDVMSFPQVIARIKRHAHQTGSSYLGASEF